MQLDYSDIILLMPDENDWFAQEVRRKNVSVKSLYKNIPFSLRIVRKIYYKLKLPLKYIWYGSWKKSIDKFKTIIVMDSVFGMEIVEYILRKSSQCNMVFWYWNPINKLTKPPINRHFNNYWSFDKNDCKKYNLKYNTQFYFKDVKLPTLNLKYDILFIGRDKGRLAYLINLKRIFDEKNITNYYYIVGDLRKYSEDERLFLKDRDISYEHVLGHISQTKAILDIVQDGQAGLTLRVMESIFFSKKLITNNKDIVNYEFYNSNNIFIIGIDSFDKLINFLNGPYKKLDECTINKYSFDEWISRFIDGSSK